MLVVVSAGCDRVRTGTRVCAARRLGKTSARRIVDGSKRAHSGAATLGWIFAAALPSAVGAILKADRVARTIQFIARLAAERPLC